MKAKISASLIKTHAIDSNIQNRIEKRKMRVKILNCAFCNTSFEFLPRYKKQNDKVTCSSTCQRNLQSIKRQNYLKQYGNFSTPRETFSYKNSTIEVDSNLEKAGIIYLLDELKVVRIERFSNLINFKEGNLNRTFNPDFICKLQNGESAIVEVKQKWNNKSTHPYNRTIPLKREALRQYCVNNKMTMIWLDFDESSKFKQIYFNLLRERRKPRVV